jgi:hypothetical protein
MAAQMTSQWHKYFLLYKPERIHTGKILICFVDLKSIKVWQPSGYPLRHSVVHIKIWANKTNSAYFAPQIVLTSPISDTKLSSIFPE